MDYIKLEIKSESVIDWFLDIFSSKLGEIGFESFMETENGLDAFIPEKDFDETKLNKLISGFDTDIKISWAKEVIKDQNWNEVWEKNYFKPLLIGNDCVVRAPFHESFPGKKYEIIIEPNRAFGTGNHETTSMMLEAILAEKFVDKDVLDIGCGTGILGILASMKGAKKITAIDIDEWCYNAARENAVFNNIRNITVKQGDASLLGDESYDFIFANIQKNVLLADTQTYSKCLNQNGKVFMSGFYKEDIPDIKSSAELCGLKDAGFKSKNNWVVYSFVL